MENLSSALARARLRIACLSSSPIEMISHKFSAKEAAVVEWNPVGKAILVSLEGGGAEEDEEEGEEGE